jgi:hypothetical protein
MIPQSSSNRTSGPRAVQPPLLATFRLAVVLGIFTLGASAAQAGTISGTVTCDGVALTGATVRASQSGALVAYVRSGAAGAYSLTAVDGAYDVDVVTPLASACVNQLLGSKTLSGAVQLDIALVPPPVPNATYTVSGRVIGYLGNGVKGAFIMFYRSGSSGYAVTQVDGSYSVSLTRGSYSLQLQPYDAYGSPMTNAPPQMYGQGPSLEVSGVTTYNINVPVVRVSGTLLATDTGLPLPGSYLGPGINVQAADGWRWNTGGSTTPDASGNYSFLVNSGDTASIGAYPPNTLYASKTVSLPLPLGVDQTLNITLDRVPLVTVSGVVTGYQGRPVPSTQMQFQNTSSYQTYTPYTDANGRYSIQVKKGFYRIMVNSNPGANSSTPDNFNGQASNLDFEVDTTFNIAMPVVQVTVHVYASDTQAALPGSYMGATSGGISKDGVFYWSGGVNRQPNDSGDYQVLLNAGSADIDGYAPSTASGYGNARVPYTLQDGFDVSVNVPLPKVQLWAISGHVTGYQGAPLVNAQVQFQGQSGGPSFNTTSDATGAYSLLVQPGYYGAGLSYRGANGQFEVQTYRGPTLRVIAPTTFDISVPLVPLVGTVTDHDLVPIPDTDVRVQTNLSAPDGWYWSSHADILTDANGAYSGQVLTGDTYFYFYPPYSTGFLSTSLPVVAVTGPLTQQIILQYGDTTPPSLTAPPDQFASSASSQGAVVNYPPATAYDTGSGLKSVTYSMPSGSIFPIGATIVTVTAKDRAGNVSTATFTVTVFPPPTLTVPQPPPVHALSPAGAPVSFTVPVTSIAKPGLGATCNPASGSTFPLGSTTVTCIADDGYGGIASGQLTVTVFDAPPLAYAGAPITAVGGSTVTLYGSATDPDDDAAHLTYLWTGPGVVLTGADTLAPSFTAPSDASFGQSLTFTLTVTDPAGKSASANTVVTLTDPTVIAYTGGTEGTFHHAATLVALLTAGKTPIPGEVVSLQLGAQSCSGPTNGLGYFSCALVMNQQPGSYKVTASYGGSGLLLPAPDASVNFTILPDPTTIKYTGATAGEYSDTVTLSATVTEASTLAPIGDGTLVQLSIGSQWCTSTLTSGVASCIIKISQAAGSYPIKATFPGTAFYAPSVSTGTFKVGADDTMVVYTGPTLFAAGSTVTVSGKLTDQSDGTAIDGQSLTITVGTASCSGTTGANGQSGVASCQLIVPASQMGPTAVSVNSHPNGYYLPAAVAATGLTFAYAPGGGSFVIADSAANVNGAVTYWGAQWSKINAPSGGAAPAAFKGYADLPVQPACGTSFTTRPGNSSKPPANVPEYMAVIASNSVTKSGSTISGSITRIVIVHTAPGYAADPGHAGTGTVVATVCK